MGKLSLGMDGHRVENQNNDKIRILRYLLAAKHVSQTQRFNSARDTHPYKTFYSQSCIGQRIFFAWMLSLKVVKLKAFISTIHLCGWTHVPANEN